MELCTLINLMTNVVLLSRVNRIILYLLLDLSVLPIADPVSPVVIADPSVDPVWWELGRGRFWPHLSQFPSTCPSNTDASWDRQRWLLWFTM